MTSTDLIPRIKDPGPFRLAFSTKDDGNMLRTNETRVAVHNNRVRFCNKVGIDYGDVLMVRTSHSCNIDLVEREPGKVFRTTFIRKPIIETDFDHYYTGSDGALTLDPTMTIGLLSGDCVPLIVWDNTSGLHGIIHVGLLGALNSIVTDIGAICETVGISPGDLSCYLGPSITRKNYNISRSGLWKAIRDQIYSKLPSIDRFIDKHEDGEHFDLHALITEQLMSVGILATNIQQYDHCIADPESLFISHNVLKNEGIRGNFLSLITRMDIRR